MTPVIRVNYNDVVSVNFGNGPWFHLDAEGNVETTYREPVEGRDVPLMDEEEAIIFVITELSNEGHLSNAAKRAIWAHFDLREDEME